MNKPTRPAPRVPAGPKSLAATAAQATSPSTSAVEFTTEIEKTLQGFGNAQVAIDAVIAIGEALEDSGDWHPHKIKTQASLLTRLAYVAEDQLRSSMEHTRVVQDTFFEREAEVLNSVRAAFKVWRDRKVEQLTTLRCGDDVGMRLDAAEISAFNALASTPSASAQDVVLKVFALATIECDDGMVHEGATTVFNLHPPEGRGYLSTMWRALLGDMSRVSDDVRAAAATATPNATMQVAA